MTDKAQVLLTIPEAAERLRVGRHALYELIRTNKLRTIRIGSRRLVPVESVAEVIAVLLDEENVA